VAESKPGATVTFTVWRDKKEITVKVTLAERTEKALAAARGSGSEEDLGLKLQDLTDDLAAKLGVRGQKGVVVSAVQPGGPAARAGLRPGDLIQKVGPDRTAVASVAEFRAALSKLDVKKGVLVLLRRRDLATFVLIKP